MHSLGIAQHLENLHRATCFEGEHGHEAANEAEAVPVLLAPGSHQPTVEELIAVLKRANKVSLKPEAVQFQPSVATLIYEMGPDALGRRVDDLSNALTDLVAQTKSHLVPERMATLTAEDVPELMLPIAKSLKNTLKGAASAHDKLEHISKTADVLMGHVAQRFDERLSNWEKSHIKVIPPVPPQDNDIVDDEPAEEITGAGEVGQKTIEGEPLAGATGTTGTDTSESHASAKHEQPTPQVVAEAMPFGTLLLPPTLVSSRTRTVAAYRHRQARVSDFI